MNPIIRFLFVAGAVVLAAPGMVASDRDARPLEDSAMTGNWTGTATIVVNWTKQRQLTVDLVIARDGTVTGRVGDATLSAARLLPNRGWLGRTLNLATDWIIAGDLTGDIIAAESVHRTRVKIPLNWRDGRFTGGINTSGSKLGGKKDMILAAGWLNLQRKK